MKSYNSFLLRCFFVKDEEQIEFPVFEVEHIQSGSQECATSLAEIHDWIGDKCACAGDAQMEGRK